VEQHAVRLSSPQERGDLRRPLGQLNEDRPTVGLLSSTSRRSAIWLRIAIETPNATIRFYRPWIRRTGALMPTGPAGACGFMTGWALSFR
jgi:hypothetical protein